MIRPLSAVISRPFVSLVIPARNEERFIGACLRSVLNTRYPADRLEVIVADGQSEDRTREEVLKVAAESPVSIRIVENPERIVPTGLNLAIREARGEAIIRLDAHAEYGEDYVSHCIDVLQSSDADNVGGPVETIPRGDSPMAIAISLATAHPLGVGNSAFRTRKEPGFVDTVPYGCFPRRIFEKIGLYDERFARNQDYELNQRIRQSGGSIYMDPRIAVRYYNQGSLRGLLSQARKNGFWNSMMHFLHPWTIRPRHLLPAFFSLAAIAMVVLTAATWLGGGSLPMLVPTVLMGFGFAMYSGLVLVVASGLARRHGWKLFPHLLAVFPSFHFCYGWGILAGWLKVATRQYPWRAGAGVAWLSESPALSEQKKAA